MSDEPRVMLSTQCQNIVCPNTAQRWLMFCVMNADGTTAKEALVLCEDCHVQYRRMIDAQIEDGETDAD